MARRPYCLVGGIPLKVRWKIVSTVMLASIIALLAGAAMADSPPAVPAESVPTPTQPAITTQDPTGTPVPAGGDGPGKPGAQPAGQLASTWRTGADNAVPAGANPDRAVPQQDMAPSEPFGPAPFAGRQHLESGKPRSWQEDAAGLAKPVIPAPAGGPAADPEGPPRRGVHAPRHGQKAGRQDAGLKWQYRGSASADETADVPHGLADPSSAAPRGLHLHPPLRRQLDRYRRALLGRIADGLRFPADVRRLAAPQQGDSQLLDAAGTDLDGRESRPKPWFPPLAQYRQVLRPHLGTR
jgi:hypothetical protein